MNCLKLLKNGVKVAHSVNQPSVNSSFKRFRKSSPCDICLYPPDKKPCFDIRNVTVELGNPCHAKLIRSFLYTHYWPREPSVVGLWMSLDCSYLEILTDKYSYSGDRFLAFEHIERTKERKLIGVCVANKVMPWTVEELEEWAHYTESNPERNHMYFSAHCLKNPNLYKKYHVPYIYNIEALGTAAEVAGQGVGKMLLRAALAHGLDMRHPLARLVSVSQYTSKICEHVGMKREWSMDYTEFVDDAGQRVFFPRRPHHTVAVYVKLFDLQKGIEEPCKPQFYKTS